MSRRLNFDLLARPYRWLEYLTFGSTLERCRFHFLPLLMQAHSALIFGDGDGRFLERLMKANPSMTADVVDISPAMLHILQKRLSPEERLRITLHCADARNFILPVKTYDLVVTHFFFDCLFEQEISALVARIQPNLHPDALWVVSEFALPRNRVGRLLGKLIIFGLYRAFGLLTGLPLRVLQNYASSLREAEWNLTNEQTHLGGLLVSQLWRRT